MFDHGTVCFRAGRTSGEIIAAGAVQTQDGERCLPLPRYSASTCASNLCGNARSIAYFLCSVFLPKQDAAFRAVEREDIFNARNLRLSGIKYRPPSDRLEAREAYTRYGQWRTANGPAARRRRLRGLQYPFSIARMDSPISDMFSCAGCKAFLAGAAKGPGRARPCNADCA